MRSNCLFWACAMWWRLRKPYRRRGARDRQFSGRGSRLWKVLPFPHFGVMVQCRDGRFRFISFKPKNPKRKILPPPLFEGTSQWGDLHAPPSDDLPG